jgi:hypothetical protein
MIISLLNFSFFFEWTLSYSLLVLIQVLLEI